jgi:hypothetical protein
VIATQVDSVLVPFRPSTGWEHICLDLETLGTGARAVVLQIGAVHFRPADQEIMGEFSVEIDDHQQGRTIDGPTMRWWFDQVAAGRRLPKGDTPLPKALDQFDAWVRSRAGETQDGQAKVWLWSKGPSFDAKILADCYQQILIETPWRYGCERCVRTIFEAARKHAGWSPVKVEPVHDALADARQEAIEVMGAMRALEGLGGQGIEPDPDVPAAWAVYRAGVPGAPEWSDADPVVRGAFANAIRAAIGSLQQQPLLPQQ